jgi:hypothetical protein
MKMGVKKGTQLFFSRRGANDVGGEVAAHADAIAIRAVEGGEHVNRAETVALVQLDGGGV